MAHKIIKDSKVLSYISSVKVAKLVDVLKKIREHGKAGTSESAIALSRAKLQHAGDRALASRKLKWAEDEVKKMPNISSYGRQTKRMMNKTDEGTINSIRQDIHKRMRAAGERDF